MLAGTFVIAWGYSDTPYISWHDTATLYQNETGMKWTSLPTQNSAATQDFAFVGKIFRHMKYLLPYPDFCVSAVFFVTKVLKYFCIPICYGKRSTN